MLISKKTTGSIYLFIYLFIASKEAYSIIRQLEKITAKKLQEAKVVKWAKNNAGSLEPEEFPTPPPLPGHLSVNLLNENLSE